VPAVSKNSYREDGFLIIEETNSICKSCVVCLCRSGEVLASARIRTAGGVWVFQGIDVSGEHRSKGYGSLVLKKLTGYLDRHGIDLYACVHSGGALSEKQLVEWYKRYGFVNGGKGYHLVRYCRRPDEKA